MVGKSRKGSVVVQEFRGVFFHPITQEINAIANDMTNALAAVSAPDISKSYLKIMINFE
ncbi:MAG: hypothetical protein Fur0025_47880 [Oscillatoriaceae cyanobacterium]